MLMTSAAPGDGADDGHRWWGCGRVGSPEMDVERGDERCEKSRHVSAYAKGSRRLFRRLARRARGVKVDCVMGLRGVGIG